MVRPIQSYTSKELIKLLNEAINLYANDKTSQEDFLKNLQMFLSCLEKRQDKLLKHRHIII